MTISYLHRLASDHNPLTINCSLTSKKKRKKVKMYKFEKVWLRDNECEEMVAEIWNHSHGSTARRVEATGIFLEQWREVKFGQIRKRIQNLEQKLKFLNEQSQTVEVIAATAKAEREIHELFLQEEIKWSQRSRAS